MSRLYQNMRRDIESVKQFSTRSTHHLDVFFKHDYAQHCAGGTRSIPIKSKERPSQNMESKSFSTQFLLDKKKGSEVREDLSNKQEAARLEKSKKRFIASHCQNLSKNQIVKCNHHPQRMTWLQDKKRNQ